MTTLVEQLVERISALPDDERDRMAARFLDELDEDERWEHSFASSIDVLERMADDAVAEHRAGKSALLDPDEL